MSASVQNTTYFSSGSISVSSLRSTWGIGGSSNVRMSSFVRTTDVNTTNPNIPDATENAAIPTTVGSGNPLRFSNFRNTIREYYIRQQGTDDNAGDLNRAGFRMSALYLNYNGNLGRNVPKRIDLTGFIGSRNPAYPAAQLSTSDSVYNLTINANCPIRGAGGLGATSTGGSTTVTSNLVPRFYLTRSGKFPSTQSAGLYLASLSGTGSCTVTIRVRIDDNSTDGYAFQSCSIRHDLSTIQISGTAGDSTNDYTVQLAAPSGEDVLYPIYINGQQNNICRFGSLGSNAVTITSSNTSFPTTLTGFGLRDDNDELDVTFEILTSTISQKTYTINGGSSGGNGGIALRVNLTGNRNNVRINVGSNASIRGGSGGGEKGADGVDGSSGRCKVSLTVGSGCYAQTNQVPSCPSGYQNEGTRNDGSCNTCRSGTIKGQRVQLGGCTYRYRRQCIKLIATPVPQGGNGGNGGNGRGYQQEPTAGLAGSAGQSPQCAGTGGTLQSGSGTPGTPGGNGGNGGGFGFTAPESWARPGQSTPRPSGSGGSAGLAIFAGGCQLGGSINSTTVTGSTSTT